MTAGRGRPMVRWALVTGLLAAACGFLPGPAGADCYGDKLSKRFHTADCPRRQAIQAKDLIVFESEAAAGARGF